MTRLAYLKLGAIATVFVLWLAIWVVFGTEIFGPGWHYWSQAAAAALTGLVAFHVARRTASPYPGFLVLQGIAYLLLALSWATYPSADGTCHFPMVFEQDFGLEQCNLISNAVYALCVFVLICSWSYLALDRWLVRSVSSFTMLVYTVLMLGLGAIFTSFYYSQYADLLHTLPGRLDAVAAAFEFAVLVAGLFCMLLRVPSFVIWMVVGTAILMAGDMGYSGETGPAASVVPPMVEAIWMLGQLLLLSAIVVMPVAVHRDRLDSGPAAREEDEPHERSGLSGILILISLGAVLLAPLVWFLPVDAVWKSFLAVLFIISLVVVLVWITDRFDDTVTFLRDYVRRVHRSRLVSEDWRAALPRIRAALQSTGLSAFVEDFRDSAARLKQDVLFLGPERLFKPPRDHDSTRQGSCFIVMPFSQEWSPDVHRILASACDSVGVRPVRGDDLFTPTDILEDIWQAINSADFVIADITGRNPNVLYELGIAHTLAKPVLILSKQADDIPIDLATRRVILYGRSGENWREDLARKISAAVTAIVEDYGLTTRESR